MSNDLSQSNEPRPDETRWRNCYFLSLTAAFHIAMLLATWKLWVGSAFPQVPLLSAMAAVASGLDFVLVLVLLCGLLWITVAGIFFRTETQFGLAVAVVCGAALILLNQHRLQPWHWLNLLIYAQALTVGGGRSQVWRVSLAVVYLFAGVSRIGPAVANGMSLQVLETWLKLLGLENLMRMEGFAFSACLCMSLLEAATGILLLLPGFRRHAIWLAVTMHLLLTATLGPWGLQHQATVLLWNVYLAIAVPLLFGSVSTVAFPSEKTPLCSKIWMLILVVMPAAGLIGLTDNWLAWQLYSPRPESIRMSVHVSARDNLPESLQPFVLPPPMLQDWCPVRLDRWSLQETGAPIYPEDRFHYAIIAELARSVEPEEIRVRVDRPEFPLWWRRQESEWSATELVVRTNTDFWWSTAVRK